MTGARTAWWSQAWDERLEALGPADQRAAARGRALARRGSVERLRLSAGRVEATVVDERPSPDQVVLALPVAGREAWTAGLEALRRRVRTVAALLDDDLPESAVAELNEAGVRLLPTLAEVEPSCSRPGDAGWCRHAVATWQAVGLRLAQGVDPLLRLQGSSRDELLSELRLDERDALDPGDELDLSRGLTGAHGDLEDIVVRPVPAPDPAAVLRHLGPPPGVDDELPLEEAVEAAAATAWRLAAGAGSEAADEELLLAELRAQRVASAASLAEALGRDPGEVGEELDALFSRGAVLRTGSGERARYRVAAS